MNSLILLLIIVVVIVLFLIIICNSQTDQLAIGHNADALLLTCIDFRFLGRINQFMIDRGYTDNYDHFALAGASLGIDPKVNAMIAMWQKTWWDHLQLAVDLHHIKKVIIIDHEDCGAYREFIGFNNEEEDIHTPNIIPIKELEMHSTYLKKAYKAIRDKYPNLDVELYMFGLKSNIIQIKPQQ